jgi:hypothetical protein
MSKCANLPARGMMCDATTQLCSDDSWCQVIAGVGTCVAPQANGAMCTRNDQCATHLCDTNVIPNVCADPTVCI